MAITTGGNIVYDEGQQLLEQAKALSSAIQSTAVIREERKKNALNLAKDSMKMLVDMAAISGLPVQMFAGTDMGGKLLGNTMQAFSVATGRQMTGNEAQQWTNQTIEFLSKPENLTQATIDEYLVTRGKQYDQSVGTPTGSKQPDTTTGGDVVPAPTTPVFGSIPSGGGNTGAGPGAGGGAPAGMGGVPFGGNEPTGGVTPVMGGQPGMPAGGRNVQGAGSVQFAPGQFPTPQANLQGQVLGGVTPTYGGREPTAGVTPQPQQVPPTYGGNEPTDGVVAVPRQVLEQLIQMAQGQGQVQAPQPTQQAVYPGMEGGNQGQTTGQVTGVPAPAGDMRGQYPQRDVLGQRLAQGQGQPMANPLAMGQGLPQIAGPGQVNPLAGFQARNPVAGYTSPTPELDALNQGTSPSQPSVKGTEPVGVQPTQPVTPSGSAVSGTRPTRSLIPSVVPMSQIREAKGPLYVSHEEGRDPVQVELLEDPLMIRYVVNTYIRPWATSNGLDFNNMTDKQVIDFSLENGVQETGNTIYDEAKSWFGAQGEAQSMLQKGVDLGIRVAQGGVGTGGTKSEKLPYPEREMIRMLGAKDLADAQAKAPGLFSQLSALRSSGMEDSAALEIIKGSYQDFQAKDTAGGMTGSAKVQEKAQEILTKPAVFVEALDVDSGKKAPTTTMPASTARAVANQVAQAKSPNELFGGTTLTYSGPVASDEEAVGLLEKVNQFLGNPTKSFKAKSEAFQAAQQAGNWVNTVWNRMSTEQRAKAVAEAEERLKTTNAMVGLFRYGKDYATLKMEDDRNMALKMQATAEAMAANATMQSKIAEKAFETLIEASKNVTALFNNATQEATKQGKKSMNDYFKENPEIQSRINDGVRLFNWISQYGGFDAMLKQIGYDAGGFLRKRVFTEVGGGPSTGPAAGADAMSGEAEKVIAQQGW